MLGQRFRERRRRGCRAIHPTRLEEEQVQLAEPGNRVKQEPQALERTEDRARGIVRHELGDYQCAHGGPRSGF